MSRSGKERDLRTLLEFRCAYCGGFKSDRPPVWCFRRHEGFDAAQRAVIARMKGGEA